MGFHKKENNHEKIIKDHKSKNVIIDKVLNKIWNFELSKIKLSKIIPFGGTCFLIARKISLKDDNI